MTKTTDDSPHPQGVGATRLLPIPQWNRFHVWPSAAALRWMVFNAKDNGFDKVIKRAGGRVLIDEAAFFKWVETQNATTLIA